MSESEESSRKPAKGPWYSTGDSLGWTIGILAVWAVFLLAEVEVAWTSNALQWWSILAIACGAFLFLLYGVNLVRLLRKRAKANDHPTPDQE